MAGNKPLLTFALPKAYGGVCFLVSLTTGACLVTSDLERIQRQHCFSDEFMDFTFNEVH